jgi:MFS family permease
MATNPVPTAPVEPSQPELPDSGAKPDSMLDLLRRYSDFRYLWFGTIFTQAGQWILNVALGWLMLVLTDSPFWVGLVGFFGGIPMLAIAVPAGVLIDRYDRRTILIWCQAGLMFIGIALAVLAILGVAAPWHLLLGAFLNGAGMSINNAARQTMVPGMVPRVTLASAIALTTAGQNASRIVGPSIAGVLIGFFGVGGAFVFQAVVLTIALGLTVVLSVTPVAVRASAAMRGGFLDGFRFVRQTPILLDLILLATIPMLFVFPYIQLLPVFARDILDIGATGLGIMMAASGVGAVAGGLLSAPAARLPRKGVFLIVSTIGYGGIVVSFAYSQWFIVSMLLVFSGSLVGSAYMSLNNTLLHMNVTDEVRGRVTGVYLITFGLMPLGGLPMGIVAELWGAPLAVAAGAVLSSMLTAVLALRSPRLRAL